MTQSAALPMTRPLPKCEPRKPHREYDADQDLDEIIGKIEFTGNRQKAILKGL
jgi:hypothetical protein